MSSSRQALAAVAITVGLVAGSAGCGGGHPSAASQAQKQINDEAKNFVPYRPHRRVELNNYNAAQRLYDDPTTIIWCTTTWGNASAPLVTVPVAGKLTSSSTSFFSPERIDGDDNGNGVLPARSVDGLYHPNPPQYRYGFTPGGQYVDFFNMPTFCTTQPTQFQRQATKLSLTPDASLAAADARAQRQLKAGDRSGAQATLEQAVKAGG